MIAIEWSERYRHAWEERFDHLEAYLHALQTTPTKARRDNTPMATNSGEASTASDREVVISRLFDAPRALVYKVWTSPEHVAQWWGPNGFTNTVHEMDVRPGGVWRVDMHAPWGQDFPNVIYYREVVEFERLVYAHGSDGDGSHQFEVTVTFTDEDGKTRVTLRQLYATVADKEFAVREYHAVEGGNQTLDRLAAYLASI